MNKQAGPSAAPASPVAPASTVKSYDAPGPFNKRFWIIAAASLVGAVGSWLIWFVR